MKPENGRKIYLICYNINKRKQEDLKMTLGEKLSSLRKEKNYTQEQLAEELGVSRQAISRWESDAAYPETEKLIRLGELYNCSMDYLLKDNADTAQKTYNLNEVCDFSKYYYEKKSNKEIFGMPLWHINWGTGRTAKGILAIGKNAKGLVAIGIKSAGVFSFGVLSLGIFSFGVLSIGLLSAGALTLGGMAAGAVAIGILAAGAIAFGIVSMGAVSVGLFSAGALSLGHYAAIGAEARAAIAIGGTNAVGTVYEVTGKLTPEEYEVVVEHLNNTVPTFLDWEKKIAIMFLPK